MANPINGQVGFPSNDTPVVQPNGLLNNVWYQFFRALWRLTGGANANALASVYSIYDPATNTVKVYSVGTGALVTTISPTPSAPGGAAQPQTLGASPFVFTAGSTNGTLIVSNGKVEWSRNGGATYYTTGLVGGTIPMALNDKVRVSWFAGPAPQVTFFPVS